MTNILEKQLPNKPELYISDKVIKEIFYLHNKFGNTEWSGILWLEVQGTITDLDNLKLKAIDFSLLDLGEPAFTTFTLDEKVLDIYIEKPELIGKKISILHTHHNMQVFFSGTDKTNLLEQANVYNYFVSTIVNKDCSIIAKISIEGKIENQQSSIKDDKGNFRLLSNEQITQSIVYTLDCNVVYDSDNKIKAEKLLEEREKLKSINKNNIHPYLMGNKINDFSNRYGTYNSPNLNYSDVLEQRNINQLDLFEEPSEASESESFLCHLLDDYEIGEVEYAKGEYSDLLKENEQLPLKDVLFNCIQKIDEVYNYCVEFSNKSSKQILNECINLINKDNFKYKNQLIQLITKHFNKNAGNL